MKTKVKLLLFLISIVLLFGMVSCSDLLSKLPFGNVGSDGNSGDENSDNAENPDELVLVKNGTAKFQIVYTAEAGSLNFKQANDLVSQLRALGITVNDPIEEKEASLVTDCEIIIGTGAKNRGEEFAVSAKELGKDGIIIKIIGNKVLIAGGTAEKTLTAFRYYMKNEMKIDKNTLSFDFLSVNRSFSQNVETVYPVKSIKIAGIDINDFTLVYDITYLGELDNGVIEDFHNKIYDKTGFILKEGSADKLDTYAHSFIIRCTSDAGVEGFRAFYDGNNFIVECSYPKEFEAAFEKLMNTLFYEVSEAEISIPSDYSYKEDVSSIGKNDVDSENQLQPSQYVSFFGNPNASLRIMFVGNSITRHGPNPTIGWYGDWGMAASSKENDYVHVLADMVEEVTDAYFCICQAAVWERNYINGEEQFELYEVAREFDADIIIMRVVENCDYSNLDQQTFYNSYLEFISYLDKSNDADLVLTSSFWIHPADEIIEKVATENGLPYVYLGDLGERDDMMAIGLYENAGVARHPGDLGMKTIAERIFEALRQFLP